MIFLSIVAQSENTLAQTSLTEQKSRDNEGTWTKTENNLRTRKNHSASPNNIFQTVFTLFQFCLIQYFLKRNLFYEMITCYQRDGVFWNETLNKSTHIYYVSVSTDSNIQCTSFFSISMNKMKIILSAFGCCARKQIIASGNIVVDYCTHH